MIAGTLSGFGLSERTAVFLSGTTIICRLAVLVHGKACLTDRVSGCEFFGVFGAVIFKRNKRFSVVDIFYRIVNTSRIVSFIGNERAVLQRDGLIRIGQDLCRYVGIRRIGRCRQFI